MRVMSYSYRNTSKSVQEPNLTSGNVYTPRGGGPLPGEEKKTEKQKPIDF